MSLTPVFQLSMTSQDDPQCSAGKHIWAAVVDFGGMKLLTPPAPPLYPATAEPIRHFVHLNWPNEGTPTPTWYFELTEGMKHAWVTVVIYTPGVGCKEIVLDVASLPGWVHVNQKEDTNQIYQRGSCGIFGYAQENTQPGQPTFWIYTLTGGVTNPQIHPPVA